MNQDEIHAEINNIEMAMAEGGSSFQEMLAEERLVDLQNMLTKLTETK